MERKILGQHGKEMVYVLKRRYFYVSIEGEGFLRQNYEVLPPSIGRPSPVSQVIIPTDWVTKRVSTVSYV